jgi:protein tyrosine/serine phosphatase
MGNPPRKPFKSTRRSNVLVVTLVGVISVGVYFTGLMLNGNFHEVIPGELYRSAQPSGSDLALYAERYGIKTVINLRGSNQKPWYKEEVTSAKELGLVHIDFRMSASRVLSADESRALITLMRDAPKPILIHCLSGADRTGLASVLYSSQIAGRDEITSERQLSIAYGHIAIPYVSSAFAMDESWEILEDALKKEG